MSYGYEKIECSRCGAEIVYTENQYMELNGITFSENFLCEKCYSEKMAGVLHKMNHIIKDRGHNFVLKVLDIKENETEYFAKYKFCSNNYFVVIEK